MNKKNRTKSQIRAEFHLHTRFSHDSLLNKYFIWIMCKLKKIKLIAITDHNKIKGAVKYKKFLERHKITVIVGEEIMTTDGEIIGLYLTEVIPSGLSAEETIEKIKMQDGLVYLPHPYDEKRNKTVLSEKAQIENKGKFDFVEVHNGRNINSKYDEEQKNIQILLDANPIIGSDSHTFFEIGRNYICMNNPTKETLVQCVCEGKFVQNKNIKFAHFWTKVARVIKMIGRGDFRGIFGIINRKCKAKNK